ncbi:MAG: hypothetical protein MJ245_03240 [Clostridia bacterium]|nr:hypothetical protein [Clostridia bacterium]
MCFDNEISAQLKLDAIKVSLNELKKVTDITFPMEHGTPVMFMDRTDDIRSAVILQEEYLIEAQDELDKYIASHFLKEEAMLYDVWIYKTGNKNDTFILTLNNKKALDEYYIGQRDYLVRYQVMIDDNGMHSYAIELYNEDEGRFVMTESLDGICNM